MERTLKFEHYLPRYGYRPRILTTSAFGSEADCAGPGAPEILRAWEPVGLYRRLRHRSLAAGPPPSFVRTQPGMLRGLRALLARHILIPDGQLCWIPHALVTALRSLRRQPAAALYSTSPPASSHLLGLLLKRLTGLPWVADFRDSWIYDPLDPVLTERPFRRAIESQMEQSVIQAADMIVTATRISAGYLRASYPDQSHKVRVITNGFDPGDVVTSAAPVAGGPSAPLRLVHTGSFAASHPQRSPQPLLTALQLLRDRDVAWGQRIRLTLVGHLTPDEAAATAELEAVGMVECPGQLPREQALELQASAHVLVLMDHIRPWPASNIPGKFFEYLALRRPILALCGPGMVAEMMGHLNAGVHVNPDDGDALVTILIGLYEQMQTGSLPPGASPTALEPFHRRALAAEMAACFDHVLTTEAEEA